MSEFLFARPSLLSGIARVLDLGGVFDSYNDCRTPREADELALGADWAAILEDLELAKAQLQEMLETPEETPQPHSGR